MVAEGYPIKQEYYTIVTSTLASLIALGFCGSVWLFAKMTKNILLYTSLSISLTYTLPNVYAKAKELKTSQWLLILFTVISLFVGSVDVLFNINAKIYISAGQINEYNGKYAPSLGPLPYRSGNSSNYSPASDSSNSVPYSAVAKLFNESLVIPVIRSRKIELEPFPIDPSCDLLSNILVNNPKSIYDDKTYSVDYDLFGKKLWTIPQDDTMAAAVWAMGPQVSSLVNPDSLNIMVLAHISLATNNSAQFAPRTSQFWLPLVSSASKGSSYIYSEGNRGRARNCSLDAVPCDPFYANPGPASNDSLKSHLVEVMDVSFGTTTFTKGPAIACFTYFYIDGQDARCIVNIRKDSNEFIYYDVLVMVNEKIDEAKVEKKLLAPYPYIYPVAAPIYLEYNQNLRTVNVKSGQYCDSIFFFDSKLCVKKYADIQYGENNNLGVSQMAMNYSYHYTVNLSTSSITLYNKSSSNIGLLTSLVSGMNPLSGSCSGKQKNAIFVVTNRDFPAGTLVVFIPLALLITIVVLAVFGFTLFWFNDYFIMLLRYVGNDFGGFTPENSILASWIGVAKRAEGWRAEVLTAKHAPHDTIICESFKKAELEEARLNEELEEISRIEQAKQPNSHPQVHPHPPPSSQVYPQQQQTAYHPPQGYPPQPQGGYPANYSPTPPQQQGGYPANYSPTPPQQQGGYPANNFSTIIKESFKYAETQMTANPQQGGYQANYSPNAPPPQNYYYPNN